MNETALIRVSERYLPAGKREVDFTWEGDPKGVVFCDWSWVADFGVKLDGEALILVGPFELRRIESDGYFLPGSYYVRTDQGRLHWLRRTLPRRLRNDYNRFRMRCIVCAYVWNLADLSPGEIPTWENLKIVKRLRGLRKPK